MLDEPGIPRRGLDRLRVPGRRYHLGDPVDRRDLGDHRTVRRADLSVHDGQHGVQRRRPAQRDLAPSAGGEHPGAVAAVARARRSVEPTLNDHQV